MKKSWQHIFKRILCLALFWGAVKAIASIEAWSDWMAIFSGLALSSLLINELLAGYEDSNQ